MIAVLDYGIGNLRSAQKALERVAPGVEVRLATSASEASGAAGVVLPGVGAFGRCMASLRGCALDSVALAAVSSGVPFLGVCIGMQMLYEGSDEDPEVAGLGVLPGRVTLLPDTVKRPQMQWNQLGAISTDDPLLAGVGEGDWVYFVHSYVAGSAAGAIATTDYGGPVVAAVRSGQVWATQFHPEKSGTVGLRLLANFVAIAEGSG